MTWQDLLRAFAAALALLGYVAGVAIRDRRWRRLLARLDRMIWLLEVGDDEAAPAPPVLFDQDADELEP